MDLKEKYKQVLLGNPTLIMGKKGINEGLLEHISRLLKKHKIIKIKMLKTALHGEKKEKIAQMIADKTNSHLLDLRGRTFILSKVSLDPHDI
ncbi:MAG: RNA-binding protein [Promethearchaeota archaeon]|nr:MAG: RNA-binding protein [Candidatus Lokiarchaeota archaeon]